MFSVYRIQEQRFVRVPGAFNNPFATLALSLSSTQEVKEVKKVRRKVLRPVALTSPPGFFALPSRS